MEGSRCWIELSKSALQYNVKQLESYLPNHEKSIAIVKANGYGHGARFMASVMEECGINDFGVAAVSEAEDLRNG
ncbi:MAG: alanine racemase, partial [Erysipelotrichaceae bacterium]|nr:alanine racemase [Erysipelotrichaceae bacterium]